MLISRRSKRLIIGFSFLVIFSLFAFVSVGRYLANARERERYEQEQAGLKPPDPKAIEIARQNLKQTRRFVISLNPWAVTKVPAEVAGRVQKIRVEPGNAVSKGDILVELEQQRAEIRLNIAKLQAKEALRLYQEALRLKKSNVVSQTALSAAEANSEIAKAQLTEAADNLERHTIRSPFDGVENAREVDLGEAVNINQPVVELVDLSTLRAVFYVTEEDLSAFPVGQELDMRLPSKQGVLLHPQVKFVAPAADPATRLFEIQATFDNSKLKLPGGLQGIIEADIRHFDNTITVPAAAVRFRGRDAQVLKDTGNTEPEWVTIQIGSELEGAFPVFEGLKEGDRVFIR
ncbi:MAG: efflux RND transporter periplasmic adaptor subunit [Chthoniobacterales bacterium]